jgi:NAD(P)-dependent dehydrogenase (short-subunit alcohol dehydrogenase family)
LREASQAPIYAKFNRANDSTGEALYTACKAAMLGFSKTRAREHAGHSVTLYVVCPGPTSTNLLADFLKGASNLDKRIEAFRRSIPLGRIGMLDDVPGTIAPETLITCPVTYAASSLAKNGLSMAGWSQARRRAPRERSLFRLAEAARYLNGSRCMGPGRIHLANTP